MINLEIPVFAGIFLLAISLAFVLGWEQAVARWRERDKKLRAWVEQTEQELAYTNRRLAEDPIQASANMGQLVILNKMEDFIHELRDAIP